MSKLFRILKNPQILLLKANMNFPAGRAYNAKYFLRKHYLNELGWTNSAKRKMPIDKNGKELPWFTYSLLHFLNQRLNNNLTVFEYGSGNSTVWFSKRVKHVISLEHHKGWYELLIKKLGNLTNVEFLYKPLTNGEYANAITNYNNEFDIVVIDGRERVQCAKNALKALTKKGVVIWDDSQREDYNEGYQYLLDQGFKRLDFYGLRPLGESLTCTSIFYKIDNCLEI